MMSDDLYIIITSNNQRLGSTFDDLDPRLSLLCQVGDDVICPAKSAGDASYKTQDPFIQSVLSHTISTPICILSTSNAIIALFTKSTMTYTNDEKKNPLKTRKKTATKTNNTLRKTNKN